MMIKPMEHELKINNEWYLFRFDFASMLKLERNYGYEEATKIFSEFIMQQNTTNNFVKILACSCKSHDIDEDFLKDNLYFNKFYLNLYGEITLGLMNGFIQETVQNMNDGIDEVEKMLKENDKKKH